MLIRILHCDAKGCKHKVEATENEDLPAEWGAINLRRYFGPMQSQTLLASHLCPEHTEVVRSALGLAFPEPAEK